MTARKRPNSEGEGTKPKEAVLDIVVPLFWYSWQLRSGDNIGIPDASSNPFVCIAAYCLLQCNIMVFGNGTIRDELRAGPVRHSVANWGFNQPAQTPE
jgi:hypothetical protein